MDGQSDQRSAVTDQPRDWPAGWEAMLLKLLSAPVFFVGLVFGFLACCFGGRHAAAEHRFANFDRFHAYIDPQTLYFPTPVQVKKLAEERLPRDKIAVIVGGSSVMQGVGQPVAELWTKRLQQDLGDEYCVLNLAMAGGGPTEFSQLVAEMLLPTHPRLIHVCDCSLTEFARRPDGNREIYRYFYRNAAAQGLLAPFPQRERAVADAASATIEQGFQAFTNHWFAARDLWQAVGYEHGFTVWQPLASKHPWQPRKDWADPVPNVAAFQSGMERYHAHLHEAAGPWSPEHAEEIRIQVRQSVPAALRAKTLVVINRHNPRIVNEFAEKNPEFRSGYEQRFEDMIGTLRGVDLQAVRGCVTLRDDDYLDGDHLLPSGGVKLARELAPVMRKMAKQFDP